MKTLNVILLIASGLFSFELHKRLNDEELSDFMDHFELSRWLILGAGLNLSFYVINQKKLRKFAGIERKLTGSLIRLHIGFEDTDELIADLQAGFDRIK